MTGSYGQFHLRPRDLDWQHCLDHEVVITPEPAECSGTSDVYGNTKTYYHVLTPHTELVITGISHRRDLRPPARPGAAWRCPGSRPGRRWRSTRRTPGAATDFTFASPMVDVPDGRAARTRAELHPGRPIGEAAIDLMHRVYADFTYKSGSTTISTRVGDLLRAQDGGLPGLRALHGGLPAQPRARPVVTSAATWPPSRRPARSGWSAPTPATPGSGSGCPVRGWLYLDPTNNRVTDVSHATVAWGRDYSDVPPVKGVIFTESKKSKMKVGVDMARL